MRIIVSYSFLTLKNPFTSVHFKFCAMGVRRNFSRGGKVDILLIFFWLLTMQRKLMYTKKENVQCYANSCIQCFLVRIFYTEQMFVLVSMDTLRLS